MLLKIVVFYMLLLFTLYILNMGLSLKTIKCNLLKAGISLGVYLKPILFSGSFDLLSYHIFMITIIISVVIVHLDE